ncbi:TetR/AcrR family transcriptional regulator [Kineococcus sp. NUM-3379]
MPRTHGDVSDPARLLTLLWRPHEARGRSGLTPAAVAGAAVGIADAEGLAAVTMRRVADALGTAPMSLYSHVPGKAELVELMLDAAAAEVYADGELPAARPGWREGLRFVAERNRASALAHPWVAEVLPARPVLGPGVTAKYDAELAPLDGIGLSDAQMDHALTSLLGLVTSAARWQTGLERVRAGTGQSDTEWWDSVGPVLAGVMRGRTFPLAERVGAAAGAHADAAGDPAAVLRFGVEALLDGIDALRRRR